MNLSLLEIYNSTVEFSTRYSDIMYFYCIPPFSVFGIILKSITFLEISFAIDRLLAFSPKERTSMKFRYKMIIMLVLSIIISLPNYLISRSIFPVGTLNGQEVLYAIKTNGLIQSEYWTAGLLVLLLLRGPVLYMTLLIINIVIVIKFKKKQKKRSTLTSKNVFLCNLMCFKSYSYSY